VASWSYVVYGNAPWLESRIARTTATPVVSKFSSSTIIMLLLAAISDLLWNFGLELQGSGLHTAQGRTSTVFKISNPQPY
jgi:hypothetical protein